MQSSFLTLTLSITTGLLISFGVVFALDYNNHTPIPTQTIVEPQVLTVDATDDTNTIHDAEIIDEDHDEVVETISHPLGAIIASYVDPRAEDFAGFYAGSCTVYVAKTQPRLFVYDDGQRRLTGNAEDRLRNAKKLGIATGSVPKIGAIAVYYEGRGADRYGHVGIVESLQDDDTIIISEMDYKQEHVVTYRVVAGDLAAGYIYGS